LNLAFECNLCRRYASPPRTKNELAPDAAPPPPPPPPIGAHETIHLVGAVVSVVGDTVVVGLGCTR
jgi:hypothetical protein